MSQADLTRLESDRVQELTKTAEWVRAELSRSVGYDVEFDATGVQLLDEWIENVLKRSPVPERRLKLLWTVFLGEVFRRRHEGVWAIQKGEKDDLVVLFPTSSGGGYVVEVAEQVRRRIAQGFAASLALYYTEQGFSIVASKAG
jgi:hypothetical protein